MRQTGEGQFFYDSDVKRYTAMFADKVVVKACASCHNKHPETPRKNWKMNDIMGATTWAYPDEYVTRGVLATIMIELRRAFNKAYVTYLNKTKSFSNKPEIGTRWPAEGYYLPSVDVFMSRFESMAALNTLALLIKKNSNKPKIMPKKL